MRVLLTGASGLLGQSMLHALPQGVSVTTTSRREPRRRGTRWMRADFQSGEGIDEIVRDIDVIIHAASSPAKSTADVDVEGSMRLLAAARTAGVSHVVYISIVGIEKVPLAYYRAKVAAERVVRNSTIPYTIVRGTQFHSFVRHLIKPMLRGPLAFVPSGWLVQPIDVHEFAAAVWKHALQAPCNCIVNVAGPEILEYTDVVRTVLGAESRRAWVWSLPIPGSFSAAMRAGALTDAAAKHGQVTWRTWCADRTGAPGNGDA